MAANGGRITNKLGLVDGEVRPLHIGQSFTNSKAVAFHSIKYDFKPASVDTNKVATVDVAASNQVTVTVPHLDGSGVPQTVFKGSQRPYQKECVLIIDRVTGQITLERLTCNIQVKKTRTEYTKPHPSNPGLSSSSAGGGGGGGGGSGSAQATNRSSPAASPCNQSSAATTSAVTAAALRSQTPPIGQRISNKTKVTSGKRRPDRPPIAIPSSLSSANCGSSIGGLHHFVPKHSPLRASPNYTSPSHHKSPKSCDSPNTGASQSGAAPLASLPLIGFDEDDGTGGGGGVVATRPPLLNGRANDYDCGGVYQHQGSGLLASASDNQHNRTANRSSPALAVPSSQSRSLKPPASSSPLGGNTRSTLTPIDSAPNKRNHVIRPHNHNRNHDDNHKVRRPSPNKMFSDPKTISTNHHSPKQQKMVASTVPGTEVTTLTSDDEDNSSSSGTSSSNDDDDDSNDELVPVNDANRTMVVDKKTIHRSNHSNNNGKQQQQRHNHNAGELGLNGRKLVNGGGGSTGSRPSSISAFAAASGGRTATGLHTNAKIPPTHLLNEDLCLSESGSDSD